MSQKMYLIILKAGVALSFVSLFLINKNYLFPYITSKQIYFNSLIEILLIFWTAFIVKYPEWRPKRSYITFGLMAFFGALILSSFFGVDFNLSFWGDIERMLGVFHLLHFLGFYLILITIGREKQDWLWLLGLSVSAAALIAIVGSGMEQDYSTIGNTAYVSGYLIFNFFFAALIFSNTKNWLIRGSLILLALAMFSAFVKANTTGAYVGLTAGIFAALFFFAVFNRHKKVRYASLGIFVFLALLTGFLFVNKHSSWMAKTKVGHIMNEVTFQKITFQTRLISWKAAAQDFKHHPVFGVGHGNYANIFDKYFDPKFYNFTRSETYFDRAHNNLIDIVSTSGLIGLSAYLAIFAAVAYYLLAAFRRKQINLLEFSLLIGLFTAYFVQNLAVFDSLVTYFSLMIALGLVYFLAKDGQAKSAMAGDRSFDNKEFGVLLAAGLVLLTIFYQYNYKVTRMLAATIDGQRALNSGAAEVYENYQKALSYDTVLDRDSRSTFLRVFSGGPSALAGVDKIEGNEILDFAIEEGKKNIEFNPNDSMMQMELAQLLTTASLYNSDDPQKFSFYSDQALEAINRSIEASPRRVPIYFVKAQIYLTRGEKDQAVETLKYAISLNEDYYDSSCQLANVYFYLKNEKDGYAMMNQCIDKGGASILSPASLVKSMISHYADDKDWVKVMKLYERMTVLEPDNANIWADLAKLRAENGDREGAIAAANKAAELNPAFKSAAEEFIKKLGE